MATRDAPSRVMSLLSAGAHGPLEVTAAASGQPSPAGVRDAETVRAIGRGEERALGALYERHATLAYSVAIRICGDAADAEDVVADAFLRVWRSARSYDPARGSVEGWLSRIVRNAALDEVGRRRSDTVQVSEADGVTEPVADLALRLDVAAALTALGSRERQVLELAYFEGLTQPRIAKRLGLPLGTVKTLTRRGLAGLRPLLDQQR